MLYFLYGTNKDKAREKARGLLESLAKKRPEASLFKMDSDNFDSARLQELIGGQGLFSNKYIVFLDSLLVDEEIEEQVLKFHKEIGVSENIFIWLEGKVLKAPLTQIAKVAEDVQVFEKKGEEKKEKFEIFSLANALRARDRKSLWVLYQKALREEAVPEAICGMLFWQVKTMLSGQSGKFTKSELENLAGRLVAIYHDAHRGVHDFDVALERMILSL